MVVLDAVGVVVVIGNERRPLQYARAGATAEAMSMETLAHCLQHTVCDLLPTSGTNRQGTLKRRSRNGMKQEESQPNAQISRNTGFKPANAGVSSPCSSPHTRGSRPCHRTACPAGGDGSSYNRNSWSGRVCSWLGQPAAYVTEPRYISHKPLKEGRRDEEKG